MDRAALRFGAIVVGAVALALYCRVAQPWAMLGWVALVPWLFALDRERRLRTAVGSGVLMSMAFTLAVFSWFARAVARYTGLPAVATHALLVLGAPLLQPQFVAFAAVRHALTARGGGRVTTSLAAACAWVGAEWLRPGLFGDTIGQGLYAFPVLRQGADLAGAGGLTLVLLLVNEAVHDVLAAWPRSRRHAGLALAIAATLVGGLAGYGTLRLRQLRTADPPGPPIRAVLVQASLSSYDDLRARIGTYAAVRHILDVHEEMSRDALGRAIAPTDLLVWPETVYPTTFGTPRSAAGKELDDRIVEFAATAGVPLLFGTYDRHGDVEYNAAVLLQPRMDAPPSQVVYRKRRPFPLTEEVPPWIDVAAVRTRLPWLGTWRAGDGPPILPLGRRRGDVVRFAPLICLDAVDPSLALDAARRGADVIVTLSNDGWFANDGGAGLHLVVSAFRSIETRLPQLRATNSGVSAVITATGEIVARGAVGRRAAIAATVTPGRRGTTLMVRWGDWLGPAACVLTLVLGASVSLRRRPVGRP